MGIRQVIPVKPVASLVNFKININYTIILWFFIDRIRFW